MGVLGTIGRQARTAAGWLTQPILPDDLLGTLNPMWSASEPHARVVELRRETADTTTALYAIKDGTDPTLSHIETLRKSVGADLVVFIYRHWVYDKNADESAAELIIAKQRNGPLGKIDLQFVGANTKFENLASNHYS